MSGPVNGGLTKMRPPKNGMNLKSMDSSRQELSTNVSLTVKEDGSIENMKTD